MPEMGRQKIENDPAKGRKSSDEAQNGQRKPDLTKYFASQSMQQQK
jgi:hypothetical protein